MVVIDRAKKSVSRNDVYGGYGGGGVYDYGIPTYHGYKPNHYELDDQLEGIEKVITDLVDEVNYQFNNVVVKADFKAVLRGIKETIIKQLGRKNARSWRKWEEDIAYKTTYYGSFYDMWDDVRQPYSPAGSAVATTIKPTTVITRRPAKKLTRWKLILTPQVEVFIKQMMSLYKSCEWGTAFTYLIDAEKKQLIMDRIYIMPVEQSGGHVKFVNESEYIIFSDISELGEFVTDIDNDTRFAGIMHSHHNMGSWHSSIDHGTIATYMNDFKSVLSIVWSNGKVKNTVDHDVILEGISDKKHFAYLVDNVDFTETLECGTKDLANIDNKWTKQYQDMLVIVKKDHKGYTKVLKRFEDTGKFIKINELYTEVNTEDNSSVIKELLK